MFAQLQAQYPAASLLTDLVSVQADLFVVKATIQIGDRPLVTGLAAARTVEAAEDQARSRAFALLMTDAPKLAPPAPLPLTPLPFPPVAPAPPPTPTPATAASVTAPSVTAPSVTAAINTEPMVAAPSVAPVAAAPSKAIASPPPVATPSPTATANAVSPATPVPSEPAPSPEPDDWARHNLSSPPPDDPTGEPITDTIPPGLSTAAQLPNAPARKAAKPTAKNGKAAPTASAASEPTPATPVPAVEVPAAVAPIIDRSEEIAQIDVEMRRLGWGRVEGREHLEKTYGKRSRQQLSDDELMEFLRYLQAQPSPSSAPF